MAADDFSFATENQSSQIRQLETLVRDLTSRLYQVEDLLNTYRPEQISAYDNGGTPIGFDALCRRSGAWIPKDPVAWPWKVYNTTVGATGQVQINGDDGLAPTLNGKVADVNMDPCDTKIGSPPAYPQLAITGNGVVYGYAVPGTPGDPSSLSPTDGTLDIFYAGTRPSLDTANPATYFPFTLATITDYATDGSGNVSFTVHNVTNYGWTNLRYCAGLIEIY